MEVVVISGKGGTGKTSITAALAHRLKRHVVCDLDVDAPNLHLLLSPEVEVETSFQSGHVAEIRPEDCTECGLCMGLCRFEAISYVSGTYCVDPIACEGCKVCVHFCPVQAIDFPIKTCGTWMRSQARFGPMVHAQLLPGEENSGRLVTLLREQAREVAAKNHLDLILCDGTPGIGCPVISSLSGTQLALVVTEPTPSGKHDLIRILDLCAHFSIPAAVIINRFDLSRANADQIEAECQGRSTRVIGRLPNEPEVIHGLHRGQLMTEIEAPAFREALDGCIEKVRERIDQYRC